MAQPQSITDLKDTGVTVAPEDTINEILPFCAQGQVGRDLLSQADYTADMQRNIGHQPGIARAQLANKQARQVSHMAAGLAQFLARRFAPGVLDDGDLDKVEAALVGALDAVIKSPTNLATLLRPGLMQPDGVTTTVNEDGLLSALGGSLLLNSEAWITESGTFTAQVDGWHDLLLFGGGDSGGVTTQQNGVGGGTAGAVKSALVYLSAGEKVDVVIGAGGVPLLSGNTDSQPGGQTRFGNVSTEGEPRMRGSRSGYLNISAGTLLQAIGAGPGGGTPGYPSSSMTQEQRNATCNASGHYGAGGSATMYLSDKVYGQGAGAPGSARVRWHDPAKAAGPAPTLALLSARRMASRVASTPATVNLYDPETGQGSVWREEDAEAKLAEGLITEAAWQEICAQKTTEEYAAWLANPDTEAERFEMLRLACEAKLTATDKLTTPDYPISDEDRAAVGAYRKAIRELNHQPGAPWDGGGELTPWPEEPTVSKVPMHAEEPEQTDEPEV